MKALQTSFSMAGRNALLTGASGHLGQEMALALARAGATVWLNGRSADKIEALVSDLRSEGLSAHSAVFDVLDADAVADFFAHFGECSLEVLVNNAYAGNGGTIETSEADAYARAYAMAVGSAEALLRCALPALRRAVASSGDASVINVASMFALVSPDLRVYATPQGSNPPFYGAAKAALLQWTRYAACEFGREGIRVNAISPGPFPADAVHRSDPEFVHRLEQKVPLGRTGRAEEIGGPILFLASPAATFVNGANLVVDGGWTCW